MTDLKLAVIVVDPGMVASRAALLAALADHGPQATDVTDVVFSHHHPDHTVNAALFPAARIHDHWAVYAGDRWIDRDADGAELGPSVRLLRTRSRSRFPPGPQHAALGRVSYPRQAGQVRRRPSRQKQNPARASARARKIPVSIHWRGQ